MHPVRLSAEAKPMYHAAAVLVSNHTVAVAAVAERLARSAGVPADVATRMYQPLLAGAVENLQRSRPAAALTGPIVRGDVDTVRRHLAALPADLRGLYCAVGREALALARTGGLAPAAADDLERLLTAAS
jgi:predicted short-subunit dehydrogenase-like oxidoreductase (DUF2520 family)